MENTTEHQYPKANTSSMAKTILVIGGAGYIGSHICKLLVKNGYAPVVIDHNLRSNSSSSKVLTYDMEPACKRCSRAPALREELASELMHASVFKDEISISCNKNKHTPFNSC